MCTPKQQRQAHNTAGRKKQVRFEDDKLEERFELELLDQDDRKAKWMSRSDFRAIQYDIVRAVQESFMRRTYCTEEENNENCFRGLEAIASSGRKVQIQAFIQDLLEVQEEYKSYGGSLKGLQVFSENHSKAARDRARNIAVRDASEAQLVHAESLGHQTRQ